MSGMIGLRRTNADKRRCVEVALKEFGDMSSRAIAELCGVGHSFVQHIKPSQVESKSTSQESIATTVKGKDGKTYPATQPPRATPKAEKQTAVEREEAEYLQKETVTEKTDTKTETIAAPSIEKPAGREDSRRGKAGAVNDKGRRLQVVCVGSTCGF